jgi:hypothetical protein
MRSHVAEWNVRELITGVIELLVPVGLFACALHLSAWMELLPDPWPVHDTDRTILLHQAESSQRAHKSQVVLVGDSSCLMNVSAPGLGRSLGNASAVLNLGTLSYLGLDDFALLLRHYFEANPARPQTVILLMHPEALRRPAASEYHQGLLARFYDPRRPRPGGASRASAILGVSIFQERIATRLIPQPLGGAYGQRYGFARDLWRHLSANQGSAVDPNRFEASAEEMPVELRLAPANEAASRRFREALPEGVRLIVGMTPVPESLAAPEFDSSRRVVLERWGEWLQADRLLADLPGRLPDALFASRTHLNEVGIQSYTRDLAAAISSLQPAR